MIHILWPTIRPETFKKTFHEWLCKAKNYDFKIIPIVNTPEQAKETDRDSAIVVDSKESGVTKALYSVTKTYEADDDDIIIVASDDFYPPEEWDECIEKELDIFNGVLVFNDGIQDTAPVVTIPIMTFYVLKKMNRIIYHPSYHHLWSDAECYANAKELGILKDLRTDRKGIVFEHRHYTVGKREVDEIDKDISTFAEEDGLNYDRRMKFSLEERLVV